jgi:DNA-binding response OmpR family regulator
VPSLLIVDDEPDILEATKRVLELNGYKVYTAPDGERALQILQNTRPDLMLFDYKLPGVSGLELLGMVRARGITTPAIMITGLTEQADSMEAECRKLGVLAFLTKPLEMAKALQVVKEALQKDGNLS